MKPTSHIFLASLVPALLLSTATPGHGQDWSAVGTRLDSAIGTDFAARPAPGYGISVVHRGKVVLTRTYGHANPEFGIPFTPTTGVPVASVTKPTVASAFVRLAQQGRVDLDAPVARHWPELPPTVATLTLRQLMSMSSGLIQDEIVVELMGTVEHINRDELISLNLRPKGRVFEPDTMNRYTYGNWRLLARLLERITGQSFDAASRQLVFEPFGMTQSRHSWSYVLGLQAGEATAYREAFDDQRWPIKRAKPYDGFGDGSLITTLDDLTRWTIGVQRPGTDGSSLFDTMRSEQRWPNGRPRDYALGLARSPGSRSGTAWCHNGGTGSNFCIYPDHDLSIVTVTNWRPSNDSDDDSTRFAAVESIVLDGLGAGSVKPPPKPKPVPAQLAKAMEGTYVVGTSPALLTLSRRGNDLLASFDGFDAVLTPGPNGQLLPVPDAARPAEDRAAMLDPAWLVIEAASGKGAVQSLSANTRGRQMRFQRLPPAPAAQDPSGLLGIYLLDGYDTAVVVSRSTQGISMRFGNGLVQSGTVELVPVAPNLWATADRTAVVRFDQVTQKGSSGFRFSSLDTGDMVAVRAAGPAAGASAAAPEAR